MKINPFVGLFLAMIGVLAPMFAWQETRFARIESILVDVSATLAEHGARLTALEAGQAALREDFAELRAGQAALREGFAELLAGQAEWRASRRGRW